MENYGGEGEFGISIPKELKILKYYDSFKKLYYNYIIKKFIAPSIIRLNIITSICSFL